MRLLNEDTLSSGPTQWRGKKVAECVCSAARRNRAQSWCGKGFQLHVVLASWLVSGAVSLFHPRKEIEAQLRDMCWRGAEESPPITELQKQLRNGCGVESVFWRLEGL